MLSVHMLAIEVIASSFVVISCNALLIERFVTVSEQKLNLTLEFESANWNSNVSLNIGGCELAISTQTSQFAKQTFIVNGQPLDQPSNQLVIVVESNGLQVNEREFNCSAKFNETNGNYTIRVKMNSQSVSSRFEINNVQVPISELEFKLPTKLNRSGHLLWSIIPLFIFASMTHYF